MGVVGVVEVHRPEEHIVRQRRLDKLTVEIRQQTVADAEDLGHGRGFRELICLLGAVAHRAVVAHQRRKHAQLEPAQQQVLGGTGAEAAQVRAREQEAAHIGRGQHLQVHGQVGPPGLVIAIPDAAVAVGANARSPAEKQHPVVRVQRLKGLPGGTGHIGAVEVVDLLMADHLSLHLVIDAPIILEAVGQSQQLVLQRKELVQIEVDALAGRQLVQHRPEPPGRIEDGRLVHIVPEAFNALVHQCLIPLAKPPPGLLLEKVREVDQARPDSAHEVLPLGVLAEVAAGLAALIGRVAGLDLHAGIDDGHQVDVILRQLRRQRLEIREFLRVHREVPVVLHIVDVQIDAVQRDAVFPMAPGHCPDVRLGGVTPAALAIAEGPLGRNVAFSDQAAEGPDDLHIGFPGDDVEIVVLIVRRDLQQVPSGVAHVELHPSGVIPEEAEPSGGAVHQQEVVGAIERGLVLGMVRIVAAKAHIVPAPLVDAPDALSQAKHQVVLSQQIGEAGGSSL